MTEEHLKKVTGFYDEIAEDYEKKRMDIDVIKEFMDLFLQNLGGNKVLDIGCGPGRDAKYLCEQGKDVTAIDMTDKFIEMTKKNAPCATTMKMDMRKLDFQENIFDGIWCCASLLCLKKEDVPKTLQGFRKVLKKEGLLYVCVKQNTIKEEKDFQEFYEVEELELLIESNGFEIMEISTNETENNVWINIFARKK